MTDAVDWRRNADIVLIFWERCNIGFESHRYCKKTSYISFTENVRKSCRLIFLYQGLTTIPTTTTTIVIVVIINYYEYLYYYTTTQFYIIAQ